MDVPPTLDHLRDEPGGAAWLAALPDLVEEGVEHWGLRHLGQPYADAFVSLVVPATRTREPVVLKLPFPHHESDHEGEALRRWGGNGAVRLLDERPGALLLERCWPGTHLAGAEDALDVLVELLPRLLVPAGEPFRALADEARHWRTSLPARWETAGRPFERALVDTALGLLDDLLPGAGEGAVLLHQDLHGDNVLAAEREPWLAIDPKPLVGEPAFAVAPIVRSFELGHSPDAVRHRLDRLTAELGLDRERARAWTVVQTVSWAEGRYVSHHLDTVRWLLAR